MNTTDTKTALAYLAEARARAEARANATQAAHDYLTQYATLHVSLSLLRQGRKGFLTTMIDSYDERLSDGLGYGVLWPQAGLTPDAADAMRPETEQAVRLRAASLPSEMGIAEEDVQAGLALWLDGAEWEAQNTAEGIAGQLQEVQGSAAQGRCIVCPHCGHSQDLDATRCTVCEKQIG